MILELLTLAAGLAIGRYIMPASKGIFEPEPYSTKSFYTPPSAPAAKVVTEQEADQN